MISFLASHTQYHTLQVSAALVVARREAEERARQQQEQIQQQQSVLAVLAQRQKVGHGVHCIGTTTLVQASRQQQAKQVAREWKKSISGGNLLPPSDAGGDGVKQGGKEGVTPHEKEEVNPQPSERDGRGVWLQAERDRRQAEEAAEQARVLEEFHQRRREAAANKLRGQAQWQATPLAPPTPQPHGI